MVSDIALARAFKTLSHPRRARLFRLLAERPELGRSLGTLERATRIKETPLIHHLREMERGGLLLRRRTGATVAHVLTPAALTLALDEVGRLAGAASGARRPSRSAPAAAPR